MLITVFSPKGGSGTTTCSALIAKSFSTKFKTNTVLIDAHNGDLQTVVGVEPKSEYGFVQWVQAKFPSQKNLDRISNRINENLSYVTFSSIVNDDFNIDLDTINHDVENTLTKKLVDALSNTENIYVIDVGTKSDEIAKAFIEASDLVFMVIRGCYIGLSRAMAHPFRKNIDVVLVIEESGRTITSKQITSALKLNCVIEVEARRDYAKSIDAGVMLFRTPKNMISSIDHFVDDVRKNIELATSNISNIKSRSTNVTAPSLLKISESRNFDIFDETKEYTNRDFWSEVTERHPQTDIAIKHKIDPLYTAHLHDALAGLKEKGEG